MRLGPPRTRLGEEVVEQALVRGLRERDPGCSPRTPVLRAGHEKVRSSDQALNSSCFSGGMPIICAMTITGSGSQNAPIASTSRSGIAENLVDDLPSTNGSSSRPAMRERRAARACGAACGGGSSKMIGVCRGPVVDVLHVGREGPMVRERREDVVDAS